MSNGERQFIEANVLVIAQRRQGAQDVAQLPQVARPGEVQQRLAGVRGEDHGLAARLFLQEKIQQLRFVAALAQRRQRDLQAVQAVIKIFAEAAIGHAFQQVAVSRADDPHIHRLRLTPQGHYKTVFQHPQQPGLQRQRHVADFIEKQRAAIGLLQLAAHAFLARTGKAATAIAEQFTFDQAFGNRRTIERDERFVAAHAGLMHRLGERFFAGTCFTVDQQRHIALENPQGATEIILQRGIAQADPTQARRRTRQADRQGCRHAMRSTAQPCEQTSAFAGTQRPTGAGLNAGTAKQLIQRAIEQGLD